MKKKTLNTLKGGTMKTKITLIVAVVLLAGCATGPKMYVIREAVDAGRIQEMDKETIFQYSVGFGIPSGISGTHPGPYRSLDDVNVKAVTGKYMGKNATFFLGKSRETDQWEVFSVMVEEDGKWRAIPLRSN
jgi:hypothetical protein